MQILVTGASSGIGRATCQALRAAGHTPVGIARDFGKYPEADFATHAIDLADLDGLPSYLQKLVAAHPDLQEEVAAHTRTQTVAATLAGSGE